jgi:hypothetical protein
MKLGKLFHMIKPKKYFIIFRVILKYVRSALLLIFCNSVLDPLDSPLYDKLFRGIGVSHEFLHYY